MRATIILCLGAALSTAGHAASIYKCEDANGRVVYSQKRCAADAERIEAKTAPLLHGGEAPSTSTSTNYQAITDRVADRMTGVKIRNAQNRIKALAEERDDKILGYREEMMRSAYNAAGVSRSLKYQELIDATRESYNARIAAKRAEITRLQAELRR